MAASTRSIRDTIISVMWRHGETLQFAFSDKDNMSEIESEDIVVKPP